WAQRAVLDVWPATATAARLVTYDDRIPLVEHIEQRGANVGGTVLDLHLRLPPGLTADDVEAASGRLAVALGAARVEVEADTMAAAKVLVSVVLDDPLAAPASEPSPLLAAGAPWHPRSGVPVGRLGDGSMLAPELLGQHWLIAGMTGTGKSTTAQSVATFLTLCSPGTAQAVVLDPKGGAEFGWLGRSGVASEVVGPEVEEACRALSRVVEVMHDRQARCAAAGRRDTDPGIISPLIVILIDEAAAYRRDKKHRDEFDRLLTLLAEQGRSSAISIVLLTQTPSVENVPASIRNNLGVRLIHRCATSSHSEVALGDGTARQPGWDASRLPYGKQYAGLGLAVCEQTAGRPRRFRSFLLTDGDREAAMRAAAKRRPRVTPPGASG
ncbi:MAG: FtsK/SpoIIIE domain-containing protein, partial [Actinomycetota bacterium]|nr:FtsK/SpoIIIE domain-containing protein [Actinomycetota bacterium]